MTFDGDEYCILESDVSFAILVSRLDYMFHRFYILVAYSVARSQVHNMLRLQVSLLVQIPEVLRASSAASHCQKAISV